MSQVSPALQPRIDALPPDLQREILSRGSRLETLNDLIAVLEQIVGEE